MLKWLFCVNVDGRAIEGEDDGGEHYFIAREAFGVKKNKTIRKCVCVSECYEVCLRKR